MAYTDKQIDWLVTAQGKAATYSQEAEADKQKTAALNDILSRLEADKEAIRTAQQFEIAMARNDSLFRLPGSGKMKWMTGDMATEVDTYADIGQNTKIKPEDLQKLHQSLAKILERQDEMLESGLFNDKDIMRELWTPLVREGVIPSNIVPDRYSDFKEMFDGSARIYEDKLAEHSKGASKYETVLEGLGFAKDTVALATSIASASITFANIEVTGRSLEDTRNIQAKQEVLGARQTAALEEARSGLNLSADASTVDVLNAAAASDAHKHLVTEYNNLDAALGGLSSQLFSDPRWVAEQRALMTATSGLLSTGLTVSEKAIQFGEGKDKSAAKSLQFASQVGDAVADKVVGSILGAAAVSDRQRGEDGGTWENRQGFVSSRAVLQAAIQGNRLAEKVLLATQAKTPEAREKAILTVVGSLGDSLAAVVNTTAQTTGSVSSGNADAEVTTNTDESRAGRARPGPWADHAGFSDLLSEGIKGAFILGADIRGAVKALQAKPNPDYAAFAAALTAGAAQLGASAATGPGQDSIYSREDLLSDDEVQGLSELSTEELMQRRLDLSGSPFTRTQSEEGLAAFGHAGYLADVNSAVRSVVEGLQAREKSPQDSEAIQANTQAALDRIEQEKSRNALEDLKKKMLDPKARDAFLSDIEAQVEEQHMQLLQVIEAASPPEDLNDAEAVKKSVAAVEALIADIKASEMKLKLIETIAAGGTKVLTRIFPVTGLADSLRQLGVDAIALARKSAEVDKWRKNAELAAKSNSIYATAIGERLKNAGIQVSQKTFNTFFSILGVASEAARLGDATGAATGISAGTSMAKALTDFGYKTHTRARIASGWKKYLEARANPSNRKAALAAISGNSTLAKCVLAYGIVEDKDPIARQVARNCGLTPEVLASSSDVCSAVVKYFETLYSDDPVVLRRVPKSENWHPGTPDLTLKSWLGFKQAAASKAYPRLAQNSCLTPAIDTPIKALHRLCNGDPFNYPAVRDDMIATNPDGLADFVRDVQQQLNALSDALRAYRPVTSEPENPDDQKWVAGAPHHEMLAVINALEAQAALILREVAQDANVYGKAA